MKEPQTFTTPPATTKPATPTQQKGQSYQDQRVIHSRPSREGDPGYQLSTIADQVTIVLEDGTEKVIRSDEFDDVQEAKREALRVEQEAEKKRIDEENKRLHQQK
jgi:hypothetical protein